MKFLLSILTILFFIVGCSNGQYDASIIEFRLKPYKITSTDVPDTVGFYHYEFGDDTTVTLAWRLGGGTPWISPNQRVIADIIAIPNTPALWSGDEASQSVTLIFDKGFWYEVTMTTYGDTSYDVRESSEGKPFYVWIPRDEFPRAVVELQIQVR